MTKAQLAPFSFYKLDVKLAKKPSAKHGAQFPSTAIRQFQKSQCYLIAASHYAYDLNIQRSFDRAVRDTELIIDWEPVRAIGYLRLGDLHSIQGRQLKCLNLAMAQSALRKLLSVSSRIVDGVISPLPDESKSKYLGVSGVWRSKVFKRLEQVSPVTTAQKQVDWEFDTSIHVASHIETRLPTRQIVAAPLFARHEKEQFIKYDDHDYFSYKCFRTSVQRINRAGVRSIPDQHRDNIGGPAFSLLNVTTLPNIASTDLPDVVGKVLLLKAAKADGSIYMHLHVDKIAK
ncbi:hypothetical protein BJV82DRAFT_669331 [Fennellomyces sp. T-0311]|nr:hypothetical protein BJV82DRAFT_669331 [Fennellomyces sp. T-0311]